MKGIFNCITTFFRVIWRYIYIVKAVERYFMSHAQLRGKRELRYELKAIVINNHQINCAIFSDIFNNFVNANNQY
jgi:hypothetical protein